MTVLASAVGRGLHLEEILTGQGALAKAGALKDKKVLLWHPGAKTTLHHQMRGAQMAEVALLIGMKDKQMVLIMAVVLGQGAEAP